jgi:hypothetical protein
LREALHERHTHHDEEEQEEEEEEEEEGLGLEGKLAGGSAGKKRASNVAGGAPAKIKSLSWNFPTSSEPTELKETASIKVRNSGRWAVAELKRRARTVLDILRIARRHGGWERSCRASNWWILAQCISTA